MTHLLGNEGKACNPREALKEICKGMGIKVIPTDILEGLLYSEKLKTIFVHVSASEIDINLAIEILQKGRVSTGGDAA